QTELVPKNEISKVEQSIKVVEQPVYPDGEFKINETRVIYAKKGTSFLHIAQQYNIPLARLFEFNDIEKSEVVTKDQLIYIQRKRKTGNNEFHIVQQGETLSEIAQSEAIRLETLLEYNLLSRKMKPAVGESLYLRTKAAIAPQLALKENYSLYPGNTESVALNSNSGGTNATDQTNHVPVTYYTVQNQETIYAISQKYIVSVDDIVKWNELISNDLKAGQQLKIYK
ncbi:MAG: LysM peptidoglycan-binding domain-containing protein, partial [Bacteroidia bacterium]|nr:LysM peptidoglycan-binding domain-containing protein [Bacteroidia bacterium]